MFVTLQRRITVQGQNKEKVHYIIIMQNVSLLGNDLESGTLSYCCQERVIHQASQWSHVYIHC